MELKPGYKQTEVGVIPKEWESKPLGEGISLLSGLHVLAKYCNTEGKGKPYITGPADFTSGLIKNTKFTEKPSTLCRRGDILVTVKGSGAGIIVLADDEYCISRQLMAIRIADWDTGYVYESLRRDSSLFATAATGLIPGLSRGDILNKKIAKPPLPEQRAIAEALSDTDALIRSLDQLIAKKLGVKQAAMQQLLTGKRRLPGFSEKWEEKRLGEIGSLAMGKGVLKEDIKPNGTIPAIPYTALYTDFSEVLDYKHIKWFIDDATETYIAREPCVLIASSSNMAENTGKASALTATTPVAIGREVIILKSASNPCFISYLLSTPAYRKKTLSLARGTTIKHLYPATFVNYTIAHPSLSEQTAIATVISDMDAEIAALEARREKTRMLKQGMMQELLTGRIRLV